MEREKENRETEQNCTATKHVMNRQKHFPKNPWKIEAWQFLC